MKSIITSQINASITTFCDSMDAVLDDLQKITFGSDANKQSSTRFLANMKTQLEQLRLHTQLTTTETVDVDFGTPLYEFFKIRRTKKDKKNITFYIKDESDEQRRHIDLETSEDAQKFIIPNCLKIMQLVPLQIASNAFKYMTDHSPLEVELTISPRRVYFSFKNFGPHTEENEADAIISSGIRGSNTAFMRGQGLGLSQVKDIIKLHKEWLDPKISITTGNDDDIIIVNGLPYSSFTLKLAFLRQDTAPSKPDTPMQLTHIFDETLPLILFHNCFEIIDSIYEIIKRLGTLGERDKHEWKDIVDETRIYIADFQHDLEMMQFLLQKDKRLLLGKAIDVSPAKIFRATPANLQKHLFPDLQIEFRGRMRKSVAAGSTFYFFVHGLYCRIFEELPENDNILVEYYDNSIEIHLDRPIKFLSNPIYEAIISEDNSFDVDFNNINAYTLSIYKLMLQQWGFDLTYNPKKLCLTF